MQLRSGRPPKHLWLRDFNVLPDGRGVAWGVPVVYLTVGTLTAIAAFAVVLLGSSAGAATGLTALKAALLFVNLVLWMSAFPRFAYYEVDEHAIPQTCLGRATPRGYNARQRLSRKRFLHARGRHE